MGLFSKKEDVPVEAAVEVEQAPEPVEALVPGSVDAPAPEVEQATEPVAEATAEPVPESAPQVVPDPVVMDSTVNAAAVDGGWRSRRSDQSPR